MRESELAEDMSAPAKSLLYPLSSICGIIIPPSAAAQATEEPEMVPNIMQVTIEAIPRPPRTHPAKA
ncbi:hypothetical protein SDC9_142935 [bioreactor metagenome]|uniref:Uncharacterized protein n=1 Tax=bioreactor metagenome TaxID=1076179 RepID=A0A645E1Z3_9ZZZZ